MKDVFDPNGGHSGDAQGPRRRSAQLLALAVLVFAECALMVVATAYLIIELLVDVPLSYGSAVAILILTAIAAVFLAVLGVHILRGSPWVRGAAMVWQVLQIAVGVGFLQGEFARVDVGWALIVPAAAVIVLLFTKPVIAATARGE